jgi:hypothetical protein
MRTIVRMGQSNPVEGVGKDCCAQACLLGQP